MVYFIGDCTASKSILQTSSTSSRETGVTALKLEMSSKLAPLRICFETWFEVYSRCRMVCGRCLKLVSYYSYIPDSKRLSSICHGAGRYHLCFWCTASFEDMVESKRSPACSLSARTETWRKVESLKEVYEMVAGRVQKGRTRWALKEPPSLLSKKSLAERPSFLKIMSG